MEEQNNVSKSMCEIDENSTLESLVPLAKCHDLSDEDKRVFFGILKRLLREPYTLQDGLWDEKEQNGKVFKLIYGGKGCKLSYECKGNKSETVVDALDIYLQWRGSYTEELSLKNLQTVQNELKALGVQDEGTQACFSLAKHRFILEPPNVQYNSTLSILDEIILTFGYGRRHKMTVMYDEKKCTAIYYIK